MRRGTARDRGREGGDSQGPRLERTVKDRGWGLGEGKDQGQKSGPFPNFYELGTFLL